MEKQPLLEVKNLVTQFKTETEFVKAVNDVSFTLRKGETIGIVGESGSGKSVTSLSVMQLIPNPPGKITGGEIIYHQWVVDTMYRCPVVAELSWHVAAGNPAWEYQFDRGVAHGAEVPYVFGTLNSPNEIDRRLSEALQQYWTNFAKTGNPGWRAFPAFQEFTSDGPVSAESLRQPWCSLYQENVTRLTKPVP